MPRVDSIERFSSRVDTYVRFRPSYPSQIIEVLERECGLTQDSIVADIASGTGIFTRLLLEHGNPVFGVEPNADMRRAGESFLSSYPKFTSINGTAEATTLNSRSMDFVTAAQAGHWFDPEKSRREFQRILKADGWLVLVWNERLTDATPFLRDYEQLLWLFGTDYKEVRHEQANVAGFFGSSPFRQRTFELQQEFDYAGVEGRLMSSSYAPGREHPNYSPMLRELRRIFELHQQNGQVVMEYVTRLYFGRLNLENE
jgi:SAM-dependent methyltransferase